MGVDLKAILRGFARQSPFNPKAPRLKPGYGERKRKREGRKVPLFAEDPALIASADEYERRMVERLTEYYNVRRACLARTWCEVRRWLKAATEADRAEFFRRWQCVPHSPGYAGDIITQIIVRREGVTPLEAYWLWQPDSTLGRGAP